MIAHFEVLSVGNPAEDTLSSPIVQADKRVHLHFETREFPWSFFFMFQWLRQVRVIVFFLAHRLERDR